MYDPRAHRLSRRHTAWRATALLAAALGTGCALDAGEAVDDAVAPVVVGTTPDEGQGWARHGEIRFRFSEPMDREAGSIELFLDDDDAPEPLRGAWDDVERTEFVAWPSTLLPQNVGAVVVADGFRDLGGLLQAAPAVVELRTIDDASPTLLRTAPQDTHEVSAAVLEEVVFEFDEALDAAHGEVEVEGLAIEAGPIRWGMNGRQIRVPVSGMFDDRAYTVTLRGFRDFAGHAARTASVTFYTSPDRRAPVLVEANPMEGDVVDAASLDAIVVTFDESMSHDRTRTTLTVDGVPQAVWGHWTPAHRTFVVELDAPLPAGAEVSLSVAGFVDLEGNAIDPGPLVRDGRLDFTTR